MTTRKSLNESLERLRFVIFMGREPLSSDTYQTQEQYVFAYEKQLERDPAKERRLIETYSKPLLPIYKQQQEQAAKLEQWFSSDTPSTTFTDEEILEELYDEIANLETESEWQDFINRFLNGLS